jgi:hypothetical protein
MEDLRNILAAKANAVIPGERYNAFRREHQHEEGAQVLHFEDVLTAEQPRRALVERIVPSLVRFLDRKKQDPENPRNVVVALFLGESCFVLQASVVLDLFCELEGTSREALRFRVHRWIA